MEEAPIKAAEPAAANATMADSTKAEKSKEKPSKEKKKSGIKNPLKKVGQIRLVHGFRSSKLRPKIALDEQKDVADNVRHWLYERRNRYERFVDRVLGRASPISVKKPADEKKEPEVMKKDDKKDEKKDMKKDEKKDEKMDDIKAVTEQMVSVIPNAPAAPTPAQRDPSGKSMFNNCFF